MPKLTIPLIANHDAISAPLIADLSRKVMRICGLPDSKLHITGEFGTSNQPGRAMGDKTTLRFESDTRFTVSAIDSIVNDNITQLSVRNNDYPPMWEDKALGIALRPVYINSEITLTFQFIASTQAEAIKWRDEHAIRKAENRAAWGHEVSYDIPIDDKVLHVLEHLHSLRESISGYGEDFVTYFNAHMTRQWSTLATQDMDADKFLLAVPERQKNLIGNFDFSEIPVENKVDGNVTWEISFTYSLKYLRCSHLYFNYPLAVHQQHIGADFFDPTPRFRADEIPNGTSSIAVRAIDARDGVGLLETRPMGGIRYPTHDEWIPAGQSPRFTVPVITWMLGLDPDNPRKLLDLKTLPEMRLTTEMLDYIKASGDGIFTQGGSGIHMQLWAGDYCLADGVMTMDDEFVIWLKEPLTLRATYHLRLSLNTDYNLFTTKAKLDMYHHSYAALQMFKTIYPSLNTWRAKDFFIGGKYLPYEYMEWFYDHIRHKNIGLTPTADDFTKQPWHASEVLNDPGLGSGASWRGGDYQYRQPEGDVDDSGSPGSPGYKYDPILNLIRPGDRKPGQVRPGTPADPAHLDGILPDSYRGNSRHTRWVQYLAIMTAAKE